MSEEIQEYGYVFVKVDQEATNENNELASPILMSSGEANAVNKYLQKHDAPNRYKLLSENDTLNNNS